MTDAVTGHTAVRPVAGAKPRPPRRRAAGRIWRHSLVPHHEQRRCRRQRECQPVDPRHLGHLAHGLGGCPEAVPADFFDNEHSGPDGTACRGTATSTATIAASVHCPSRRTAQAERRLERCGQRDGRRRRSASAAGTATTGTTSVSASATGGAGAVPGARGQGGAGATGTSIASAAPRAARSMSLRPHRWHGARRIRVRRACRRDGTARERGEGQHQRCPGPDPDRPGGAGGYADNRCAAPAATRPAT